MPRQLRIQYPGAMYHVMSRGNRRQAIFLDDVDRQESERRLEAQRLETGDEEGLKALRRGWPPAELASRRKHDPAKLEIAARLRRETTLSVKKIATGLHLGTPKSASVRLLRAARQNVWGDLAQRSLGL